MVIVHGNEPPEASLNQKLTYSNTYYVELNET